MPAKAKLSAGDVVAILGSTPSIKMTVYHTVEAVTFGKDAEAVTLPTAYCVTHQEKPEIVRLPMVALCLVGRRRQQSRKTRT